MDDVAQPEGRQALGSTVSRSEGAEQLHGSREPDMKTSSEGFQQCYNAQTVVDGDNQVVWRRR